MRLVATSQEGSIALVVLGIVFAAITLIISIAYMMERDNIAAWFLILSVFGIVLIAFGATKGDECRYICEDPTLTVRDLEEHYTIIQGPKNGYWVLEEREP